ncbi:hypothetical protein J7T55_004201 [Diaporthe amygdali]|uniref:uncharacterized protein n=1 Tax=Phomopsis amygdali TaxID=1214568 RepID=UPI0022FE131B|nr:uncharacterized protein J7T55_004201 [Diaporthe amygdali]KAJ0103799.1 hypothetical protein J7T55_004201 [Diaporthe amygdali]
MQKADKPLPPLPLSARKILVKNAQPPQPVRLSPSVYNPSQSKSRRRDARLDSTNRDDTEDPLQKLRRENEDLSRELKLLESTSAAKEHLIAKLQEDNRRLCRMASRTRQRVADIATTISEAFEQYQEFTEAQSRIMDTSTSEPHCDEIRIYAEADLANTSRDTNLVTNVNIDTEIDGENTDSLSEYSIEF